MDDKRAKFFVTEIQNTSMMTVLTHHYIESNKEEKGENICKLEKEKNYMHLIVWFICMASLLNFLYYSLR